MHSPSPYSVPITEYSGPGLTHHVYDAHLHSRTNDQLPTVCGATIIPAPMASPIGRPCQECETRIGYLAWGGSLTRPRVRQRLPRYVRTVRQLLLPRSSSRTPTCKPACLTQRLEYSHRHRRIRVIIARQRIEDLARALLCTAEGSDPADLPHEDVRTRLLLLTAGVPEERWQATYLLAHRARAAYAGMSGVLHSNRAFGDIPEVLVQEWEEVVAELEEAAGAR